MEFQNKTATLEFILLGFTNDPQLQLLIFILFLVIYLVTILGNLLIILAVSSDSHLHTPMYFFLSSLSLHDICLSTTTVPNMLVNIQTQDQSITYKACLSQMSVALILVGLENCLLAVMAYDCYVAICHPLRYKVILTPCFCILLVLLSLLINTVHALLHTLMALQLSFCTDLEIPHIICELAQVIKFACSDTFTNNFLIYLVASIFAGISVFGFTFSYIQIVSSILSSSSVGGRYKAFSTCGSHLSVVSLFYGTAFTVHMSSTIADSPIKNAVASMMYTVVPQMLNPFIYSLRNREVKVTLKKLIT
ncbi:olfactory receptor 7G2-like [Heterocephalus glaber]|uniref:Olfactory receptor 7G2-like n=1 Tax=Heterocephalus glaber TaxID=10181 RepID=A0AAX6QDG9_HETGA|nr:olfactory receptor 7G2-like [Heterocephalus glaber]